MYQRAARNGGFSMFCMFGIPTSNQLVTTWLPTGIPRVDKSRVVYIALYY